MGDNEIQINRLDQSVKLKEAFVEGSYEDKDKQKELKAQGKLAWLRERVVIKLLNEIGDEVEGCVFSISRRSLTRQFIQIKLDNCPRPCIVDYVYDNNGMAMAVEEMQQKALPLPTFYVVVPERLVESYDVLNYTNFDGKTGFFLHFVPLYCDDRTKEVDEQTLLEWIQFAILESDVSIEPYYDNIERCKVRIKNIQREMKATETRVMLDVNNNRLEGEAADKERKFLYDILSNDLMKEEKTLEILKTDQESYYNERKSRVSVRFEKLPIPEGKLDIRTWRIFIHGVEDSADIESILIDKKDWSGIRLASHSVERGLAPWAGRGVVPVGKSALHPDYSGLEVKMSAVQLSRVPHGIGVYRALDRNSSSISADKFGLFYGQWSIGKKEGYGLDINDAGVYAGQYENGFRRGKGRLDYGDGTAVVGNFSVNELRPSNPLGGFLNPYLDGEPNGYCEILFADGGLYKGEVVDGRIEGYGEYQSGFGDVLKGNFVNGKLQGEGSMIMHDEETFQGEFENGELSGYGEYHNARGDYYKGEFLMGLKHGRGTAHYPGFGEYTGFHTWGMMSGKGEFHYGSVRRSHRDRKQTSSSYAGSSSVVSNVNEKVESTEKIFNNIFHGYLLADKIASGGLVMGNESRVPRAISQRIERESKPFEAITSHLTKQTKRSRRNREKMRFVEEQIRVEAAVKKHKIFRQQRHETKKAMYEDDINGSLKEYTLDRRYRNREGYSDFMAGGLPRVLMPGATINNLEGRNNHLKYILDSIQPNEAALDDFTSSMELMQVAVSDIEEIAERQRFIKYDKLWERAEAAFIALKEDNA